MTTRTGGAKNPPSCGSESTATGNERPFKVDREELGRFDLKRAGLPDMSIESAAKYIDEHRDSRPWLAMTDRASPEARRIIAAMDAAGGHAHIRHEGWVTEEANRRRVAYREDPAQLDPEKRSLGIDGLRQDDRLTGARPWPPGSPIRMHSPPRSSVASSILKSRRRWTCRSTRVRRPDQVAIPIAELLGPDGHRHCTGWRLEPVDGSMKTARRKARRLARGESRGARARRSRAASSASATFKDGDIIFAFRRNEAKAVRGRHDVSPDLPAESRRQHPSDKGEPDVTVLLGTSSGRPVRDPHRGRDKLSRPRKLRSRLSEGTREARGRPRDAGLQVRAP